MYGMTTAPAGPESTTRRLDALEPHGRRVDTKQEGKEATSLTTYDGSIRTTEPDGSGAVCARTLVIVVVVVITIVIVVVPHGLSKIDIVGAALVNGKSDTVPFPEVLEL